MREPGQVNLDVFSPEEVLALVRAAESEQDGAIFLTAAFTGLRRGELIALRWRDVDFPGSMIRVRASYSAGALTSPKSGKIRSVPMAPQVAETLARLGRAASDDALVFVGEGGGRPRLAPNPNANTTTYVPLTSGHIDQLTRCRDDLARTNLDRLDARDNETDVQAIGEIDADIQDDRAAIGVLSPLIGVRV
jgi:integrase